MRGEVSAPTERDFFKTEDPVLFKFFCRVLTFQALHRLRSHGRVRKFLAFLS